MRGRHLLGISAALVAAAFTLAVAFAGAGGEATAAPGQTQPQRPNVLIVETDDQTLAEMDVLPNVRRLIGGQGVTFDNNFDSFSLCCPSRATLLTGQYSHNNGVRGNALPQGGYYKLDSTNTLAVWLQRAGYYTMHVGKYLNGYGTRDPHEIPPGWSDWHGSVDPTTYRYYNYMLNENGQLNIYCAMPEPSCYQTDVYRDKANEIIRARAGQGPLFLWVAFLANHSGGPREPDDPTKSAHARAGAALQEPSAGNAAAAAAELQRGGRVRQAADDPEPPAAERSARSRRCRRTGSSGARR